MQEPTSALINALPKSCMGFVTKSGETFFLHKEDIENIVHKIIIEGSLKKTAIIVKESDRSIEKANILYGILQKEKDMKPELRNKYLKQIGELLSVGQKTFNAIPSGEEVDVTESEEGEYMAKS